MTVFPSSEALARRIRLSALDMCNRSGSSHIGSIYSVADIVAVLYADILRVDPAAPKSPERDRFVLSKGHAGAAVYVALAACGFFPEEELLTHCQNGSRLSGHVSHKGVPGVDASTGSLGQGLPMALGMALTAKRDGLAHSVFAVIGDGECDEGAVWESALIARQFQLDNLIVTLDYNKIQSLGFCEETISLEPIEDKWRAFGFRVFRVDGHDHAALRKAYRAALGARGGGKPAIVIADTVKGKGVSFMENTVLWHYRVPRDDEYARAKAELEANAP